MQKRLANWCQRLVKNVFKISVFFVKKLKFSFISDHTRWFTLRQHVVCIVLRGHNRMHFAIGHIVLFSWIQTSLSLKPEFVSNQSKKVIRALSFVKKKRRAFTHFKSFFLRNRSLSNARWFCANKTQNGEGKFVFD